MKENGYIPQSRFVENPQKEDLTEKAPRSVEILGEEYADECRAGIGRNGEIIRFSAGRHRISLAKILQLEKIPILIVVRHEKWQELRDEIRAADNIGELSERARQALDHPDMQDILPE